LVPFKKRTNPGLLGGKQPMKCVTKALFSVVESDEKGEGSGS